MAMLQFPELNSHNNNNNDTNINEEYPHLNICLVFLSVHNGSSALLRTRLFGVLL